MRERHVYSLEKDRNTRVHTLNNVSGVMFYFFLFLFCTNSSSSHFVYDYIHCNSDGYCPCVIIVI